MTREEMASVIRENHYTHSVPSGKSWYYEHCGAVVVFSIPPNPYISAWLLRRPNKVLELSRIWAPDGHHRNLLTETIAKAVTLLRADAPGYDALVSYADPNVGHSGHLYRAASWVPLGSSEESRYYRGLDGQAVSRRSFHSGSRSLRKAEILALGYTEEKLPGKIRFARGLTRKARRMIASRGESL